MKIKQMLLESANKDLCLSILDELEEFINYNYELAKSKYTTIDTMLLPLENFKISMRQVITNLNLAKQAIRHAEKGLLPVELILEQTANDLLAARDICSSGDISILGGFDAFIVTLCQPTNVAEEKYIRGCNADRKLFVKLQNIISVFQDMAKLRYREVILEDQDRYEELRRVCETQNIPYEDAVTGGIIRLVANVTSQGFSREYLRQNPMSQDEQDKECEHYHDMESIDQLQIDPITNRLITQVRVDPLLTKKLDEIVANLAKDANYYKHLELQVKM